MTTRYIFHRWIETSDTAPTVVLSFGGWWDADAGGGEPPAAPSNFSGVAGGSTSIDWDWQDNSLDESGFHIWRPVGSP